MKFRFTRSVLAIALAVGMAFGASACSGKPDESANKPAENQPAAEQPAANAPAAEAPAAEPAQNEPAPAPAERSKVTVWYNYTGDEAETFESAVSAYNASQELYTVEGMSMTDAQKLIVAMSSDEAPDVVKTSNLSVLQYQANGLLENLSPYLGGYDLDQFSGTSIKANSVDGSVYGLPLTGYSIQMYYNKDLLAAAGYTEPPKTVDEMYEMALKVTTTDADGNIDVLGYPLFPFASARQELIYAFGGRWWDDSGKPTPDNAGVIASLNRNVEYRNKYGIDAVNAFIATANTNRYTENDMFFAGKQLFRLDGAWLPNMMKTFNSNVNWGVAFTPSVDGATNGTSRFETDSVCVPLMAKNKEGAADFCKWMGETGARIVDLKGGLPALKRLYTDAEIIAQPGYDFFTEALQLERGVQYPVMNDFSEYVSMINAALDEVYAGTKTPEAAMADLKAASAGLQ